MFADLRMEKGWTRFPVSSQSQRRVFLSNLARVAPRTWSAVCDFRALLGICPAEQSRGHIPRCRRNCPLLPVLSWAGWFSSHKVDRFGTSVEGESSFGPL